MYFSRLKDHPAASCDFWEFYSPQYLNEYGYRRRSTCIQFTRVGSFPSLHGIRTSHERAQFAIPLFSNELSLCRLDVLVYCHG